jgi:hypothetical protein
MAHPDNHFYGHNRALARYAGLEHARIRGHLQHGWSTGHGFGARVRQVSWLPLLGWGNRTCDEARAAGLRNVTLIGAPFVYLASTIDRNRPKPRGTVVYPFHGTDRQRLTGSHARLAAEIAEREQGPVTVCLYWADRSPDAVAAYEAHGFTVTSHGRREDPGFLERQLDLLRRHDRIVTNRVGSALWYGAHLGLEAEIYGPTFGIAPLEDVDHLLRRFARSEWPELHRGPVDGDRAAELADVELGAERRRAPEELADLLGGTSPTRLAVEVGLARVEHGLRRVAVQVLRRLPGLAAIDAMPMPHGLGAIAESAPTVTEVARAT